MPYDKGDFTQQGIDGKVSGGLLLNNKRDVDVLVTTNEDDSTLDRIAVTVEDHLNDLKYAFFGENLEAGEVYEIGAGGGGSNITPILSLTLTEDSNSYTVPKYCIVDGEVMEDEIEIEAGETANILITNDSANFIYLVTEDSSSLTYAITDLVNCTKLENEGSIGLMITDPSQNASATMKISGGIS